MAKKPDKKEKVVSKVKTGLENVKEVRPPDIPVEVEEKQDDPNFTAKSVKPVVAPVEEKLADGGSASVEKKTAFIPAGKERLVKAGTGVIRHRKVGDERRKIRTTFESFYMRMKSMIDRQLANGRIDGWERCSEGALDNMKEELRLSTNREKLTEKDNELQVALLAMFVDFHKQSVSKQRELIGEIG